MEIAPALRENTFLGPSWFRWKNGEALPKVFVVLLRKLWGYFGGESVSVFGLEPAATCRDHPMTFHYGSLWYPYCGFFKWGITKTICLNTKMVDCWIISGYPPWISKPPYQAFFLIHTKSKHAPQDPFPKTNRVSVFELEGDALTFPRSHGWPKQVLIGTATDRYFSGDESQPAF